MNEPAITFVLYSEDSARDALETLECLLQGMLKSVCPSVKMNHVRVEPVLPRELRISGSYWKAKMKERDSQRLRAQLLRAVATQLAQGRVVFFHVDADAIWRDRERACENLQEHWPRFCHDVLETLRTASKGPLSAALALSEVLILAMPFYELESWAFSNVKHLHRILRDPRDMVALSLWAEDLGKLDELANSKDQLTIRDVHNADLVKLSNGFPTVALLGLGKSYSATVERLRSSPIVARGLQKAAEQAW